MDSSREFHFLCRKAVAGIVCTAALGFSCLYATEARADMCLNSGHPDPGAPKPDAGDDGSDGPVSMAGKRKMGAGLLASASVATVWLSLRRSKE